MLSAKGVKAKALSQKQIQAYCGRGLPLAVKQQPIGCKKKEDFIGEQAWRVEANEAFRGDLLGMIAEILAQMMQRRSKGRVLDEQDKAFLRKILEEKENKEGMAGTMAKAAAPRKKEEEKKGKKKQQRKIKRTEEEMDMCVADAMFNANETMVAIRKLASGEMQKKEAA